MKMNLTSIFIASVALLVGVGHADEICEEEQTFQEIATLDLIYEEECEDFAFQDEEQCSEFDCQDEEHWGEFAQQDEEDAGIECMCEDGHVAVDSRPLSPQTKQQMIQARQAESEQTTELTEDEAIQLGVLIIPIKTQNLIALSSNDLHTTAAALPPSYYRTIENFPPQAIIQLDDGSQWVHDRADAYILRNWKIGDNIVITPKQQYVVGSNYQYMITNTALGESINVNLFLGPRSFGQRTFWVTGIDKNLGKIYVLNGIGERTVWEISNSDMYLVKDWKVNDTIVIGENDSWLWYFSSYNQIIINVNMNHYVRAKNITPKG